MNDQKALLRQLCDDYWQLVLDFSPQQAQQVGDKRHDQVLAKESMADYEKKYQQAKTLYAQLDEIDATNLSKDDALNYAMLDREIGNIIADYELDSHLRPSVYPFSPPMLAGYLLQHSTILNIEDGRNYLARLEQVSGFIHDHIERFRAGFEKGYRLPKALLEPLKKDAVARLEAPADSCEEIRLLLAQPSEAFDSIRSEAIATVEKSVKPAQKAWCDFIDNEFSQHTVDSIALVDQPQGECFYQHRIQMETASDLAPDVIHELGLKEVGRISHAMQAVVKELEFDGDLKAFQEYIASDTTLISESAEALKGEIEKLSMRINRKIPEFFGRLPRMTYGVESIPEAAAAGLPPAYAQPNPANGKGSGIHWITSLPEKAPRYMHIPLALHEAWPGHLMHLALLQEQDYLPDFRRYGAMNYISYLEGWALYCERLGYDMGLYDDPIKVYGHLDMEMWRACRLVVDTGIHFKGWSRTQAIEYMQAHTSLPEATVVSEVDRYIGLPAQALAYKVGELKIRELRERAEMALKEEFSLRDLHDQLIACGAVTMDVLDGHIQSWIDAA